MSDLRTIEIERWLTDATNEISAALDHLVALESELTTVRQSHGALISPAHSFARKFLVEHHRRNASTHG